MSNLYVLDACAMLAILSDEPGADVVDGFYTFHVRNRLRVGINSNRLFTWWR